jgi:hypothetical protein
MKDSLFQRAELILPFGKAGSGYFRLFFRTFASLKIAV